MKHHPRTTGSARTTGLLLAVGIALIASGVTLFVWMNHRTPRTAGGDPGAPFPEPPERGQVRTSASPFESEPTEISDIVRQTGSARLQFVDRDDPDRVAGQLEWSALEPLDRGRSHLTDPRAWIYLDDGRIVHISAEEGHFYMPERQSQPESGRLTGQVLIRLYNPEPGVPVDLDGDRPEMLVFTESLTFDSAVGELSTLDRVQINTADLSFRGVGMRMLVNQVLGRLELLEIERGESITYTIASGERARTDEQPPEPGPAPTARLGAGEERSGPAQEPAAPVEVFYRAVFSDNVRLSHSARTLTSDRLEVWARTVDGRMPDGAIAGAGGRQRSMRDRDFYLPSARSDAPLAHRVLAAAVATVDTRDDRVAMASGDEGEETITLDWSGSLVVRPLDSRPEELSENEVALRFTAERTGLVRLNDPDSGFTGRCAWLDYGATSQDLVLAGPGPRSVRLSAENTGRFEAGRIELNVGTGLAHIPGPGVVLAVGETGPGESRAREISWSEQADLEFETSEGRMTADLRQAIFRGAVRAREGDALSAEGDFLHAAFVAAGEQPVTISRLIIEDSARISAGVNGSLSAQRIDVGFTPGADPSVPEPSVVTASGDVRVQRRGTRLSSDFLEATLEQAGGEPQVETVLARGSVSFSRPGGVRAGAEELRAHAPTERADLIGRRAFVARGQTRIEGDQIRLDGLQREIFVHGPGDFAHMDEGVLADAADAQPRIAATWTASMRFDDLAGIVECVGDAEATSRPSPFEIDVVRGETLRLELSPIDAEASPGLEDVDDDRVVIDDRALLRAEAVGLSLHREGGSRATAQSRRYALDSGGGRVLERMLYLEGDRIDADDVEGTLTVPGAGRAVLQDRRERESGTGSDAAQEAAAPGVGAGSRGTSLFTWEGSMRMHRETGQVTLERLVRLIHQPLGDDPLTELECERLEVTLRERGAEALDRAVPVRSAELVRAAAFGAVYARSGEQELIADSLVYDAVTGVAEAEAEADNRLTLFDARRGSPVVARAIRWDMVRDRVEVTEPLPVVLPR